MAKSQAERLEALRAAHGPRLSASRAAFEAERLALEAQRAVGADTVEVLTPQAFVTKLVGQGGPLGKGARHDEEADHQG